jgi:hypothetical protein
VFKFQRKLAILTVPAVLALGAVSYGTVVGFASPSPTSSSASEPAESTTAADAAEPNEPALPGGGYADAANAQADTQQEGVH